MEPPSLEHWRRVEALLDAVLDGAADPLDPARGDPRGAGPDVRAEVERLLGFRDRLQHFLDGSAAEFVAPLLPDDPPPDGDAPARVGPYRILGEAGRGGMATVYLAERDDPQLRQRVAVKVLRDGIAGRSLVRWFIAERQILAGLDHPGIARLLDGGITEEGLPWFAMEYVEGVPITRYCDRRRLGTDARLELFLRVCDAVQYAHRMLIVHRDLKPSNILVAEPGPAETIGRIKLLDFGIAKLLAPDADAAAGPTRTRLLPLTPEYASPEQLRGEPASTASDVYQLGVLLYELLTGRPPHRLAGLPIHEIHRIVLEDDAARPSSVAAGGQRRRLRGDLDNILMKALQRAPAQRYASVERLADDLRRHLDGQPVTARPDTVRYRTGKFVRRHRIGVAAAALVFLLLSGVAGAMTLQATRLARERDRAERATAFLVDLFEALEPLEAGGVTVTVPAVLRRGLDRARTELGDQPLLQATVLDVIAHVYELQGLHAEAEPLLEEALAIRFAALGPRHLDVADSRRRLADLRYARGRYETESLYAAALASYQELLGEGAPETVRTRIGLALLLRASGRYAEAEAMLQQALDLARPSEDLALDAAVALAFLGKLRTRAGDYGEAERRIQESLDLRQALLGRRHPAVANSLDALGELMLARGAADSAETFFREALAIRRELYDEGHSDIASGLTYLARARLLQGDDAAADSLLLAALPGFRRAFGDDGPDVADALEHLGAARMARGDLAAADSLFARALAIWRSKPVEPTHDRPATLLVRIGALRLARGELEEALSALAEGLALRQAALPEGHWKLAEAMGLLGICLAALGRADEARPLVAAAYDGLGARAGDVGRLAPHALRAILENPDLGAYRAERRLRLPLVE